MMQRSKSTRSDLSVKAEDRFNRNTNCTNTEVKIAHGKVKRDSSVLS